MKIKSSAINGVILETPNGSSPTPPTPTELPIIYEETYDLSKIVSGYLTSFADKPYGLYFRLANDTPKCLATIDYRWEGEVIGVSVSNDGKTLNIDKYQQPRVSYTPSVSADITSYNYSDTSTHTISGRAESNWWLIIPKTSFGSTTNVLNVRSVKATATSTSGNVDLSSSSIVSVWKIVDNNSLPEAIVIDPNATIGDLMLLLDVRNTSNAQVSVNDVEFVIQTTLGATVNFPLYQHIIIIYNTPLDKYVGFYVPSNSRSVYTINTLSNNKLLNNSLGVFCILTSGTDNTFTKISANGTDIVVGDSHWILNDCTIVADNIVDLSNIESN